MRRLAAWRFAALTVGAAAGSAPLAVRFVALDGTTRVGGANGAVDLGTVAATRAIEVAVAADSVPPGHDLAGLAELPVQLAAGKPAAADFVVKAQRSIEGQVARATAEPATVIAEEIGRRVTADGQTGRFVLRGLPPGRLSLVVESGGRHTGATIVEVPQRAGKVSGVVLRAP